MRHIRAALVLQHLELAALLAPAQGSLQTCVDAGPGMGKSVCILLKHAAFFAFLPLELAALLALMQCSLPTMH